MMNWNARLVKSDPRRERKYQIQHDKSNPVCGRSAGHNSHHRRCMYEDDEKERPHLVEPGSPASEALVKHAHRY
jgi:hypothetical protein